MRRTVSILSALLLLPAAFAAAAPVSREIPFSFTTKLAVPATYSFRFSLWDGATAATSTELWSETAQYALKNVTFSHRLGSRNPFAAPAGYAPVDFSRQLWVQANVRKSGAWVSLGARTKLPVAAYALWSASYSPESVTTIELADGAVTAGKLADGATLAEILDDDGPGSGLDADLLDGLDSEDFAPAGHVHEGAWDSASILDGTILNEDISDDAAIADTKLALISTPGKVADSALPDGLDRLSADQTVTGLKTFAPVDGDAPFAVDPSKAGTVANLNADLVDGRHAGNAAGNVAVSNGAPNVNLYAERAQNADTVGGVSLAGLDARYGGGLPAPPQPLTGPAVVTTYGFLSSIAIGTDGLPVIAYYGDLQVLVAHCGDVSCSAGNTISLLEAANSNWECSTSIAIGTDGLPVVSYCKDSGSTLRVAHCGDRACSSGNQFTTLESGGGGGVASTSIAIGSDGKPIVAYYSGAAGNLRFAKCSSVSCGTFNAPLTLDAAGGFGLHPKVSIITGADGYPVVSYYDGANLDLKVAHCGNTGCTSGNLVTTLDATGDVGRESSVAIGTDGLPVVSYLDASNADLKVAHCAVADCSSGTTVTLVDAGGAVGAQNAITIGTDGLPFISYFDNGLFDLKVVRCGNVACTAGSVVATVDTAGDVGQFSSCTVGVDGVPIVSYNQAPSATYPLKVLRTYVKPLGRR